MKLSHRLNSLQRMILHPYRHIWDCCCDHGQLGAGILTELHALANTATANATLQTSVHFVDIIPSLMQQVEDKLQRFFPQGKQASHNRESGSYQGINWQVHCLDVGQLPIFTDNSRQLVIIAGVGGALTLKLVQAIRLAYPLQPLDFLLCPVHHQFELRQGLKALNLGLIDETLIVENRRFYELIYVSSQSTTELSAQGDLLWQQDSNVSKAYLKRTLDHYSNMLRSTIAAANISANKQHEASTSKSHAEISAIIEAYQKIQAQLTIKATPET
ncbi:tRNA (adenine(22)-N(1))-methyltransferase TrmK [Shewanella sp. SR44-3]|uniref:tRNA (adenine(22)-N(1))-methyltransferase TrmK n=1 Tax=Shewanella sp. SR44-3 TaxID=2760936 RepID=UPI0015FBE390|nr:tRNA (adenine(22)-N(1))-methyltransferase TrmK [Shewanella sp. SR44-3]MBB1270730.1 tRNA (adenine(22)-N(1))-methyltransferase TrmK [Shewanella sp. SR44-3]